MSLFGDDAITIDASPEESGHEEEMAAGTDNDEGQEDGDTNAGEEKNDADQGEGGEKSDSDDTEQSDNSLIAGKFKSQEDLINGYLNAQRKITEQAQQLRQLQHQEPVQLQKQAPAQQAAPNDMGEAFWDSFQQDPIGTLRYLIDNAVQTKTAPIIEQRQNDILAKHIDAVAQDYTQIRSEEGMGQLLGKVQEIAQEFGNPSLAKNPTPRMLRMAAQELFGDSKATLYEKGKQKGREEAEAVRQAKKGLSAPVGARKPAEKPRTEEDSIREGIVAAGRAGKLFG